MNKFFYDLTKRNWGFPWHIIIAWGITDVAMIWVPWFWILFGIIIIGFIYERIQDSTGTVEDMIANVAGFVFGALL